jgi:pyruvate,water dikinase
LGASQNIRRPPVSICGEAPANYPEVAAFLTRLGVDSISVNPSSLPRTIFIAAQRDPSGGGLTRSRPTPPS